MCVLSLILNSSLDPESFSALLPDNEEQTYLWLVHILTLKACFSLYSFAIILVIFPAVTLNTSKL